MQSRKKFIESQGATCKNWQWSWSFINEREKIIIFGLWDVHTDGLIFSKSWEGKSRKQSIEHIRLIEKEGYQLKTFPMEQGKDSNGNPRIKGFNPILSLKFLSNIGDNWYASDNSITAKLPEEITLPERYIEGATTQVSVNVYERNKDARKKCIDHYGYVCAACEFDFEDTYGELGRSYIHVHHRKPLSQIKCEYELDPIKDLIPVCPNCHAMIHKTQPPLTIEQLKNHIKARNKCSKLDPVSAG